MNDLIGRPQFFAGQMIDFRDLNRLGQYSEALQTSLWKLLYPNGGILARTLEEFRLESVGNFKVRIRPGIGITTTGQVCALIAPLEVDLETAIATSQRGTLHIGLRTVEQGRKSYVDPEDPGIQGFQEAVWAPEVVITLNQPGADALELFRVSYSLDTPALRISDSSTADSEDDGIINIQFRSVIWPNDSYPVGSGSEKDWRVQILNLRKVVEKIIQREHIPDEDQLQTFINLIYYETFSQPFILPRAQYLLTETGSRLRLFLDRWLRTRGFRGHHQEGALLLNAIGALEKLSHLPSTGPLSTTFPISTLFQVTRSLEEVVNRVGGNLDFMTRLRSSLKHFTHLPCGRDAKLSFYGEVFEKFDEIQMNHTSNRIAGSATIHPRYIKSSYLNLDPSLEEGLFIHGGKISIQTQPRLPVKPIIILFQHHLRESKLRLNWTWNDSSPQEEVFDFPSAAIGHFINFGIIIPAKLVQALENKLTFDLGEQQDFNLFAAYLFQPTQNQKEGIHL